MSDRAELIPIFDGHNDTVMSIEGGRRSFFERGEHGHIDLPRAKEGGLAGGFFAVFVEDLASPIGDDHAVDLYADESTMPPMMSTEHAQAEAVRTLSELLRVERESGGSVKIVRTAAEVRRCIEDGTFAIELHLEGAEPIDEGLDALHLFYQVGVRSLGLVWSRPNRFARGVPFKFPASPNTGTGLTDAGRALVRECNGLGILLDVSHLNEAGFWEVANLTDAPIVATHSCVHAICQSTRNLTDKQLDAIRDSDGIVGINFHVGFLNPTGERDTEQTTASTIADHADYLVNRIGIDRVALGSDYDGATMPGDVKDAAGMQKIIAELRRRGYDDASLRKIGFQNWLRIFERTWKA